MNVHSWDAGLWDARTGVGCVLQIFPTERFMKIISRSTKFYFIRCSAIWDVCLVVKNLNFGLVWSEWFKIVGEITFEKSAGKEK